MPENNGSRKKPLREELASLRDDIAILRQTEGCLRAELEDKNNLLKEIHHRIKNNLQVISGFLNVQTQYLENAVAREALKESQDRIRTVALIHENLYRSPDFRSIDMGRYLGTLAESLAQSYGLDSSRITLHIDMDEVCLPSATAVPCGLIANELLTNALKYAFPDGRRGNLVLGLKKGDPDGYRLRISDDGVGFQQANITNPRSSLGLKLVLAMAEQLKARVDMNTREGSSFTFHFQRYDEA